VRLLRADVQDEGRDGAARQGDTRAARQCRFVEGTSPRTGRQGDARAAVGEPEVQHLRRGVSERRGPRRTQTHALQGNRNVAVCVLHVATATSFIQQSAYEPGVCRTWEGFVGGSGGRYLRIGS